MKKNILATDNLAVGYNRKILIKDINISVKPGMILTIIGANGSGKSTILRTIAGQLESVMGTVFIDSENLRRISRRRLSQSVSVMMTDRIEPELMTCQDIVEYGRYPYTGQSGYLSEYDRIKVRESMELTHTLNIAQKNFNCISDGQRQRVMLARAVCQEPDILILDEPTSFLDIRHKLELLSILKKLVREKNTAVIMSLHELDLAQRISDYVICTGNGKIDRCGTPEEIFSGDYISSLYGISSGSYNECIPELEPPEGNPEVFVIAGGGKGTAVFRRLQRMNIPFAAGIIHENDIDYPTARVLAGITVAEKAFEPICRENFIKAVNIIDSCKSVICCCDCFSIMNSLNRELKNYAVQKKLLIDLSDL